jgi:hypothetical protein
LTVNAVLQFPIDGAQVQIVIRIGRKADLVTIDAEIYGQQRAFFEDFQSQTVSP